MPIAIQDCYAEEFSHCYGCGRSNPDGRHLKSSWDGDEIVAHFTPGPELSGGVPGHVYGGLIAQLFDCHGTAAAAAFNHRAKGFELGGPEPLARCVTATLKVEFQRPTPMGCELVVRARLNRIEQRKVWVDMTLTAGDKACASAEMLAVVFQERPAAPSP